MLRGATRKKLFRKALQPPGLSREAFKVFWEKRGEGGLGELSSDIEVLP